MSDTPDGVRTLIGQLINPEDEFARAYAHVSMFNFLNRYAELLERSAAVPKSEWDLMVAENAALKARVEELVGRLEASRDMVKDREAKIAELSDALWKGEQR